MANRVQRAYRAYRAKIGLIGFGFKELLHVIGIGFTILALNHYGLLVE
jgi:hypothetical protein